MNRLVVRCVEGCLASLVISLAVLSGCSSSTTHVITEEDLDVIREELAADRCRSMLDSISFEMEGRLYRASIEEDGVPPLEELIPDSVSFCPSTGEPYTISETDQTITVTCPAGHGSVTVFK